MVRCFALLDHWRIGLILVIVLMVFGVGKLPQVGGAINKGLHLFHKAQSSKEEEVYTGKVARKLESKIETLETS